jgi:hypothetical protein
MGPAAMMARAGHSDFKTTQGYIDLAGETFRDEAKLADERLFGQKLGQTQLAGCPLEQRERPAPADLFPAKRRKRSGVGVEPTKPWVARPDRF